MPLNSLPANKPVHLRDFLWAEMDARGWRINQLVKAMHTATPEVSELRHLTAVRVFLDAECRADVGHIVAYRIGRALGWENGDPLLDIERKWKEANK